MNRTRLRPGSSFLGSSRAALSWGVSCAGEVAQVHQLTDASLELADARARVTLKLFARESDAISCNADAPCVFTALGKRVRGVPRKSVDVETLGLRSFVIVANKREAALAHVRRQSPSTANMPFASIGCAVHDFTGHLAAGRNNQSKQPAKSRDAWRVLLCQSLVDCPAALFRHFTKPV